VAILAQHFVTGKSEWPHRATTTNFSQWMSLKHPDSLNQHGELFFPVEVELRMSSEPLLFTFDLDFAQLMA
jgi:hypothetical protein